MDDVQYADEVSGGHMGLCARVRWTPLLLLPQASGSDHVQETDLSQSGLKSTSWVCVGSVPVFPGSAYQGLLLTDLCGLGESKKWGRRGLLPTGAAHRGYMSVLCPLPGLSLHLGTGSLSPLVLAVAVAELIFPVVLLGTRALML